MPARLAVHDPRESRCTARAARGAVPARIAGRASGGGGGGSADRATAAPPPPHARRAVVFGRARLMVVRGGMVLLRWSVRLVSPRATALARGRCVVSRVEGIGRVSIDGRSPRSRRGGWRVPMIVAALGLPPRLPPDEDLAPAGASRWSSPRAGFLRACLPTRTSHRPARPDDRRAAQASSAPASRLGPRGTSPFGLKGGGQPRRRRLTSSQFTTFHQAARYSLRRFWYFR